MHNDEIFTLLPNELIIQIFVDTIYNYQIRTNETYRHMIGLGYISHLFLSMVENIIMPNILYITDKVTEHFDDNMISRFKQLRVLFMKGDQRITDNGLRSLEHLILLKIGHSNNHITSESTSQMKDLMHGEVRI